MGVASNFFTPSNSERKLKGSLFSNSSCHIFQLNSLKDSAKVPVVDLLMLNTLRRTKSPLLTLKVRQAPESPSPNRGCYRSFSLKQVCHLHTVHRYLSPPLTNFNLKEPENDVLFVEQYHG